MINCDDVGDGLEIQTADNFLLETPQGVILNIKVFPNASKNEISDIHGNALRIRIASAPVKGKANKECIKLLADFFGIKKSQVRFERGETSRSKQVLLEGIGREEIQKRLKYKIG